ncbi:zinc finger protein 629-like [Pseudophryne corroboree]|uniref:zinc finger protein 629-like n=1 Tax=Pseudophryne corroboree TaxID=495146 RepID=UPI003081AA3E
MGSNSNGDFSRDEELGKDHLVSSWSDGECSTTGNSNSAVDSDIYREDQSSKSPAAIAEEEQGAETLLHKPSHKPRKHLTSVLSTSGHQMTPREDDCINEDNKKPSNFAAETQTQKAKTYTCICGKGYTSSSHLYRHQKTHTGENQLISGHSQSVTWEEKTIKAKSYTCICGKSYTISSHLYRHQKTCARMHDENSEGCVVTYLRREEQERKLKPYVCACGKSYTCSSHLYRHQRSQLEAKTESEKRYICDCGKSYGSSSHLYRHQRTHTEERFLVEEQRDDSVEDTEI